MNKSIIVFGATGNTGLEICKKLKEHQLDTTAFVRENSENKLKGVNIDIVVGNILKPEDVVNALNKKVYTDIVIALGSRD